MEEKAEEDRDRGCKKGFSREEEQPGNGAMIRHSTARARKCVRSDTGSSPPVL